MALLNRENKEMSSSTNINPKSCSYGCNTHIYWNVSENAYFEVFTRKKHMFVRIGPIVVIVRNQYKKSVTQTTTKYNSK